jgi:hypothetical protein
LHPAAGRLVGSPDRAPPQGRVTNQDDRPSGVSVGKRDAPLARRRSRREDWAGKRLREVGEVAAQPASPIHVAGAERDLDGRRKVASAGHRVVPGGIQGAGDGGERTRAIALREKHQRVTRTRRQAELGRAIERVARRREVTLSQPDLSERRERQCGVAVVVGARLDRRGFRLLGAALPVAAHDEHGRAMRPAVPTVPLMDGMASSA